MVAYEYRMYPKIKNIILFSANRIRTSYLRCSSDCTFIIWSAWNLDWVKHLPYYDRHMCALYFEMNQLLIIEEILSIE